MGSGIFQHEEDLLKHYVRYKAWLPTCRKRLEAIGEEAPEKSQRRRLKYFTFCAMGAMDVLMLDVENVIRTSKTGFDTVYFFDIMSKHVVETRKRIPGANGFTGDFVEVMLTGDPQEGVRESLKEQGKRLEESADDTAGTRAKIRRINTYNSFVKSFPFDVINLDLYGYLFKPSEPVPGQMIRAFREVFRLQKRPLVLERRAPRPIERFSLMFTTPVGPLELTQDYMDRLRDILIQNLNEDETLQKPLEKRTGFNNVEELQRESFEMFFKIAVPKVLTQTLMAEGWVVDPASGIKVFEFERPREGGPYKMLHFVIENIEREDQVMPGQRSLFAKEAYKQVTHQIFSEAETVLTEEIINNVRDELEQNIAYIKSRRERYLRGDY